MEIPVPLLFEDKEGRPVPGARFTASYSTGGPILARAGVSGDDGRAVLRVPFEAGSRFWIHIKDRAAWGSSPVLEAPPASPLRLVVEPPRTIEVAVEEERLKDSAWFALGEGNEPLQVWPGATREEEGRLRFPVMVPASATVLRLSCDGRTTKFPIPAGDGTVLVRID